MVSIPPDRVRRPGEVNLPARAPGDPATTFVARKVAQVEEADFDRWVRARAASLPKRRALVFVHGYNNRFDDAVFRFAQLVHDTNAAVVPVLFTWIGFLVVRIPLAYFLALPEVDLGVLGTWHGLGIGLYGAWLAMFADLRPE